MTLTGYESDSMSSIYAPLGQIDTKSAGLNTSYIEKGLSPRLMVSKRSKRSVINLYALITIALVPVGSMIVWGCLGARQPEGEELFSCAPIGGRFTQPQAKAIDVVCGAVLAPLLLVFFNYIWFTSARVAAVNELDKKPTTLHTLSIASATATGSYNVFDIWQLIIKSRAPRIMLLGCLVMCAAVASSALANVIAYEAYTINTESSDVHLQYLWDDQAQGSKLVGSSVSNLYQFSQTQTATFSEQFTGMLTGVSIQNAKALLNGSEYYLVNATTASLNALKGTTIELPNVPALKYTIDCQAEAPVVPFVTQKGLDEVSISMNLNTTARLSATHLNAYYPGQIETLESSYNDRYDFLAFSSGLQVNESYMGFTTSFDLTNDTFNSTYGVVRPVAVKMSAINSDFTGTKEIMSWWGMRCWIKQTPGNVNLHRVPNATWTARDYTWDDTKPRVTTDWALSNLQLALDYKAPGSTLPGIGPALAWSNDQSSTAPEDLDYGTTALNMLYAECETKRIIFETAATNHSRAKPEYFYNTTAIQQAQFYRITYVPFILFAGELAVLLATTICLGLTIQTWRSESGRTMRKVDVLRLVVDTVAGLQEDIAFKDLRFSSNDAINNWADRYSIRYVSREETSHDRPGVVLSRASEKDCTMR